MSEPNDEIIECLLCGSEDTEVVRVDRERDKVIIHCNSCGETSSVGVENFD